MKGLALNYCRTCGADLTEQLDQHVKTHISLRAFAAAMARVASQSAERRSGIARAAGKAGKGISRARRTK